MSANFRLVAWWLACSVTAVLISNGFARVRMTLNWDQQSQTSTPVRVAHVQSEPRLNCESKVKSSTSFRLASVVLAYLTCHVLWINFVSLGIPLQDPGLIIVPTAQPNSNDPGAPMSAAINRTWVAPTLLVP